MILYGNELFFIGFVYYFCKIFPISSLIFNSSPVIFSVIVTQSRLIGRAAKGFHFWIMSQSIFLKQFWDIWAMVYQYINLKNIFLTYMYLKVLMSVICFWSDWETEFIFWHNETEKLFYNHPNLKCAQPSICRLNACSIFVYLRFRTDTVFERIFQ